MINIHVRELTDEVASLAKQLDQLVDHPKKAGTSKRAFLVLLTDDPETANQELSQLAKTHNIKNIPLTYFDGLTGPRGYKIARRAEVTVMMWKREKIAVNRAFAAGALDEVAIKEMVAQAKDFFETQH